MTTQCLMRQQAKWLLIIKVSSREFASSNAPLRSSGMQGEMVVDVPDRLDPEWEDTATEDALEDNFGDMPGAVKVCNLCLSSLAVGKG